MGRTNGRGFEVDRRGRGMSKYYKEEDLERALIGFIRETGIDEKPYDYAVNVIDDLPTIEVSEDCISREWLISFIDAGHLRNPNEKCYSENDVVELIKNAPSVVPSCQKNRQVERAEGEWIPDPDGGFRCSNCRAEEDEFIYGTGMRYVNGESEFCPNCGAKMKGADDD